MAKKRRSLLYLPFFIAFCSLIGGIYGPRVEVAALDRSQKLTLFVLVLWVIGVVGFKLHVGLSAFAAALILIALRAAEETTVIRKMPWGIMLMVTGMAVLIAILE